MQELEKRIGLLRLLLADIQGKQQQLTEVEGQYRAQLSRIVEFVVYREGDVANALSLMSEVQGKLDEVVQTAAHLKMIADKTNSEVDVLALTKRVAEARSQLARLEERQKELSSRLSHLPTKDTAVMVDTNVDINVEERQEFSVEGQMEDVNQIQAEIARLNQLITEASERAARTIQAGKA